MNMRYLLVLSDSEGIHCIGPLPRIGEQITVRKRYVKPHEVLLCRVVNIRYSIDVSDEPFDDREARGSEGRDDIPEVYVGIERRVNP